MALTALPEIQEIQATDDGSSTIIVDSTTYGGANLEREDVSVHLLAYKVDDELTETAITVEEFDPTTVDEFTIQNTTDGHQKFIMLIAPIYGAADNYTDKQVVYHPATESLYQNTSGGDLVAITPGSDSSWEALDLVDLYALIGGDDEPDNLIYTVLQTVLTFAAQACLGLKASAHARDNCAGCTENTKAKEEFDELWLLVYVAAVASTRGRYTEGERFMRSAEKFCDCC